MPENKPGEFQEIYRSYNEVQLLTILQNKADYQAAAIEAAQAELNSRNLSAQVIEAAKAQVPQPDPTPLGEHKPRNISMQTLSMPGKQVQLICLVLGAMFLFSLYKQADIVGMLLSDDIALFDVFFCCICYLFCTCHSHSFCFFSNARPAGLCSVFGACIGFPQVFYLLDMPSSPKRRKEEYWMC